MKRSGFVEHQKVVNVFLLGQYVPRIFRIHLSAKVFKRSNGIWAKTLFNLFLYILASHNTTARNITLLNEHCPLDTPDGASSSYNFGIFLDSLKNQNAEHKKFITKFHFKLYKIQNSFVFRTGDPVDCMVFIIRGTMCTYASSDSQVGQGISSTAIKPLGKCHFYGEELLYRASDCFTELPVSSKHVKSLTKVEAFVLMAKDLEAVISRCPLQRENGEKKGSQKVKGMAASTIATAFRRQREQSKPYM
ncbi:hypothetical protein C1H46_021809 [Malus baccata]|uniref:Cyclic nucleotide-binding domain-containing protein n=1 Tax=Malus baccata TaxID=106549 RepID=A0A540K2L4_MALBA|nr:hypothetical protein C1H46_021809 [Malus baccata]